MLPFSHCYFHGLQKILLDSQLPRQQWLEMTMRPPLTGQEELLVWKAFLAFYHVIWFDISGQILDRNKMWNLGLQYTISASSPSAQKGGISHTCIQTCISNFKADACISKQLCYLYSKVCSHASSSLKLFLDTMVLWAAECRKTSGWTVKSKNKRQLEWWSVASLSLSLFTSDLRPQANVSCMHP